MNKKRKKSNKRTRPTCVIIDRNLKRAIKRRAASNEETFSRTVEKGMLQYLKSRKRRS
jgi:hypothetical protein